MQKKKKKKASLYLFESVCVHKINSETSVGRCEGNMLPGMQISHFHFFDFGSVLGLFFWLTVSSPIWCVRPLALEISSE